MQLGIVIPIYNRPQYVQQCFDSLRSADIPKGTLIVLVDDASTDAAIKPLIGEMVAHYGNDCIGHTIPKNVGVKGALIWGIDFAFDKKCDIVINLDSDAIVKSDFAKRLTGLHAKINGMVPNIISGFNNPKEPILHNEAGYCFKKHANGINMCFNREQYENRIKPALLSKSGNWDYIASESAGKVAITTPSVVQHIGYESSMGHTGADVARDFKMLSLPDVTLFGIDSHDIDGIERAADISQQSIDFGAVNIITDDLFTKGGDKEVRRRDYSRFMLKELTKHFDTSHVLTIHADGYVVNWKAWSDEYLQYDYIGATWGYKDNMNVGNGGFSLRSKKLCDVFAEQDIDEKYMHPEDHHICRTYRKSLEDNFGIKFAPEEVANRFAIEGYGAHAFAGGNAYGGQFGFHSSHVDFSNSDIPHKYRLQSRKVPHAVQAAAQRRPIQPARR